MTGYRFVIPELTPSLNKLVKGRTHWREYTRMKESWFYLVKLAVQGFEPEIPHAKPNEKRYAEVLSHRVALLDKDNLTGGMKILWDAMVNARLLFDDGPKFFEATTEQIQVRKHKLEKTDVILFIS
jgi:Holliday junction resolvase RusA-like endonuclease